MLLKKKPVDDRKLSFKPMGSKPVPPVAKKPAKKSKNKKSNFALKAAQLLATKGE